MIPQNAFPGLQDALVPWIGKTMRLIDAYINTRLGERGLSLTRQQIVLLKILMEEGPMAQGNLAFITDRDKTSLTRLVNTMEKKNLVARITSAEDKRVNLVHITKNGEKVLNETAPVLLSIVGELQEGISETEKQATISSLKRIQQNAEKLIKSCNTN